MTAPLTAFALFRQMIGSPRPPNKHMQTNLDQFILMQESDGLNQWVDGPKAVPLIAKKVSPPVLDQKIIKGCSLWVVRLSDVVYAPEHCPFGRKLESKVIKHTNLTGGEDAFSGGEVLFMNQSTIVLNGCSGRYGPRTEAEMDALEQAFSQSGYHVWSMGFDEEAGRAMPFLGVEPKWVG